MNGFNAKTQRREDAKKAGKGNHGGQIRDPKAEFNRRQRSERRTQFHHGWTPMNTDAINENPQSFLNLAGRSASGFRDFAEYDHIDDCSLSLLPHIGILVSEQICEGGKCYDCIRAESGDRCYNSVTEGFVRVEHIAYKSGHSDVWPEPLIGQCAGSLRGKMAIVKEINKVRYNDVLIRRELVHTDRLNCGSSVGMRLIGCCCQECGSAEVSQVPKRREGMFSEVWVGTVRSDARECGQGRTHIGAQSRKCREGDVVPGKTWRSFGLVSDSPLKAPSRGKQAVVDSRPGLQIPQQVRDGVGSYRPDCCYRLVVAPIPGIPLSPITERVAIVAGFRIGHRQKISGGSNGCDSTDGQDDALTFCHRDSVVRNEPKFEALLR
jgi:hypothetical protein